MHTEVGGLKSSSLFRAAELKRCGTLWSSDLMRNVSPLSFLLVMVAGEITVCEALKLVSHAALCLNCHCLAFDRVLVLL